MTISENQLPQIQSVGPMNFQIKESSKYKQELNSGCQHWNSQLMLYRQIKSKTDLEGLYDSLPFISMMGKGPTKRHK